MILADDSETCQNCGTARSLCLLWKMQGHVACCPECKHIKRAKTADQETTPARAKGEQ